MKPTIAGVVCPKCDGKGSRTENRMMGGTIEPIEVVCGECSGEGVIRFKGAREGVEWERE
jgi:DnaJ-class molecular chaperone